MTATTTMRMAEMAAMAAIRAKTTIADDRDAALLSLGGH
jgi:hypothetical protein